jgi:hypothetical protein
MEQVISGAEAGEEVILPAAPAAPTRNVTASMDDVPMEQGRSDVDIGEAAILPAGPAEPESAPTQIVSASIDDVGMGNGEGAVAAMAGIHASVAGVRMRSVWTGWGCCPGSKRR